MYGASVTTTASANASYGAIISYAAKSGEAITVEPTSGEVDNSRESIPTDLYVVDGIQWTRAADGAIDASGGDARRWKDWTAEDSGLTATRYRYVLPSGGKPPA